MPYDVINILKNISRDYNIPYEELKNKYLVESKQQSGRKCGECGEYGHNKRTCPILHPELSIKKEKKTKSCKLCGELGHNSRTCLKRKIKPVVEVKCKEIQSKKTDRESLFYSKKNLKNCLYWMIEKFGSNFDTVHQGILLESRLSDDHNVLLRSPFYKTYIYLYHRDKVESVRFLENIETSHHHLIIKNNKFIEIFNFDDSLVINYRLGDINKQTKFKFIVNDDNNILDKINNIIKIKVSKGYTQLF